MKNSIVKRALTVILAGAMIISTAITASATEDQPAEKTGNNRYHLEFGTSNGELTVETVRNTVYKTDDDGHDGFNGVYNFQHSGSAFNMAGHYPMLITFDIWLGSDVGDGTYQIIGKMNDDYGVQIVRDGGSDTIQAYCNAKDNTSWPTYKLQNLNLSGKWTTVSVLFDGYAFWLSATGSEGFTKYAAQGADGFALRNTETQRFAIGYNHSEGTETVIPENIFYDNVKMYRLYKETTETAENASAAQELAAKLSATDPILTADVVPDDRNLVAVETEYWSREFENGTMQTQDEDDEWLYQIKSETTGRWENIPAQYFYQNYTSTDELLGTGTWMQSSAGATTQFHYSKLSASQITCTFGTTGYSEDAYAWRVREDGYYRATLVNPIGNANGIPIFVRHSAAADPNTDGEVLLEGTYNAGETFTSRIVKAEKGDIIRIGSNGDNKWATGFEPAIEAVTVREYAEQYLGEMDQIDTTGKPGVSAAEFAEAKAALETALTKDPSVTDDEITEAVTALENAEANLDKYTVTYVTLGVSGETQTVSLKQDYNDSVTIVTVVPEGKYFVGWRLGTGENGPVVSQEISYEFLVAGDMTVTAVFANEETELPASVSISNVHIIKRDDGSEKYNVRFNGQVVKPEGYGLYEAGLLWSTNTIDMEQLKTDTDPVTVSGVKKVNVSSVSASLQYSVTINNVPTGNTIYGVAFAKVYNPKTEKYEWIYSDMQTAVVAAQGN